MQLFSGSLSRCTDATLTTRADCLAARDAALAAGVPSAESMNGSASLGSVSLGSVSLGSVPRWENPTIGSFDDVFSSMLLLYVMSTRDGWQHPMYGGGWGEVSEVGRWCRV